MICVYASNTIDFNNNGLGVLDKYLKAEVDAEINGDYTFTLTYPISDKKSKYLQKGNIIKAPVPKGEDYFIIKKRRRSSSNVEVLCVQISDELSRNGLTDVRPTNLNGFNALNWMKDRAQYPTRFSFSSDINKTATAYYVRKNFLDAIMGDDENSFLKVWGGELDRNKFNFNVVSQLGSNRGFRIENGKNLIDIEETIEGTEVTRIMPTGRDENDTVIQLPEGFIDSPLINNYPTPSIKYVDFPNVKVSRQDAETEFADKGAVYAELRKQVSLMYTVDNVDRPSINFSVDFLDRRNIKDVKELGILQQLYLGDIVTIHSKKLDIDIEARLRKYTWDCVKKKYTKLELGDYTKAQYTANAILNNRIITFQAENYEIGNKLKQALGGHIVKREGELLIMDTDSIATATKVWRFNLNGLGYSSTGYNGNYGVAITMDGEIVANFIRTGELDASLIKVGIIESKDGSCSINLENGEISFSKGSISGPGLSINLNSGDINFNKGTIKGPGLEINLNTGVVSFDKGLIEGLNSSWDLTTGVFTTEKSDGSKTYQLKLGNGGLDSDYYLDVMSKLRVMFGYKGASPLNDNLFYAYENGCVVSANKGYIQLQVFNGDNIYLNCFDGGKVSVGGNLEVTGNKNCIQETKNYGRVPFYSTEDINSLLTKTPIDELQKTQLYESTGKYKCIVPIGEFIRESINTDIDYNVWLTKLGQGDIWVNGIYPGYFVVESDREVSFKYKIEGRRRNFENMNEESYLKKFYKEDVV